MGGMPGGRRIFGVGARTRGGLLEVDGLAGVTDGLASPLRVLRVTDGPGPREEDEPLASSEPESSEPESSTEVEVEGLKGTAAPGPFGFAGAAFEARGNTREPLAFFCAGG